MALLVSGIVCELREVKLADKPQAMIEASPKATVPVLILCNGRVVDENLDIMRWVLGQNDPEGWLVGNSTSLICTNDGAFKHHLDRYKYPTRHGADPVEHRTAAAAILADLDDRLLSTANLLRDERSLADIAIMPFIRQFAETDRNFFNGLALPRLQSWLARHIGAPLFDRAMVRFPPWRENDARIIFGLD